MLIKSSDILWILLYLFIISYTRPFFADYVFVSVRGGMISIIALRPFPRLSHIFVLRLIQKICNTLIRRNTDVCGGLSTDILNHRHIVLPEVQFNRLFGINTTRWFAIIFLRCLWWFKISMDRQGRYANHYIYTPRRMVI